MSRSHSHEELLNKQMKFGRNFIKPGLFSRCYSRHIWEFCRLSPKNNDTSIGFSMTDDLRAIKPNPLQNLGIALQNRHFVFSSRKF